MMSASAQIYQKVGSNLVLVQGSDTLVIDGTAKYTTALLQNIKGTVAASTNSNDSSLVWDAISRSIKKRLITGGSGGASTTDLATATSTGYNTRTPLITADSSKSKNISTDGAVIGDPFILSQTDTTFWYGASIENGVGSATGVTVNNRYVV